jgi:glycyl-tRNA synthetase
MSILTSQQTTLLQTLQLDPNSRDLQTQIQAKISTLQAQKKPSETRVVLKLPLKLAPYKLAILPLMKKDGLRELAEEIYINLRKSGISCDFDEAGSIGKRYRRQDENGTPFCVCVDYETLENGTVTVRDRDSMEQKRIKIEELQNLVK